VRLDHIAQKPIITRTVKDSLVKSGTKITLHWPELACLHSGPETGDFYNVLDLVTDYAAFNPHARFVLTRAHTRPPRKWSCRRFLEQVANCRSYFATLVQPSSPERSNWQASATW
jgi:hypothetical protein